MTRPLLFLWLTFIPISGCGIFETRQPQPPQQGRTDFQPPTAPSVVVDNMTSAIGDKNVDNYLSCLSDTSFGGRPFSFVPAPDVFRQYQAIFASWDKNSEGAYFRSISTQSSATAAPALTLSSVTLVQQGSDSAQYNADYVLIWPSKVPGYPHQQFQGNLQLYLGIDRNQNWSIYRWIDSRTGDSLTWGDMKARFSQ
ncbi:MAG TPA: hypothetical protein VIS48_14195 [Candidatus Kryptonia bacterium]